MKKPKHRNRSEAQRERFADPKVRQRHAAAIPQGVASAHQKGACPTPRFGCQKLGR